MMKFEAEAGVLEREPVSGEADFIGSPEVAVTEKPEVIEKLDDLREAEMELIDLDDIDGLAAFASESAPAAAPEHFPAPVVEVPETDSAPAGEIKAEEVAPEEPALATPGLIEEIQTRKEELEKSAEDKERELDLLTLKMEVEELNAVSGNEERLKRFAEKYGYGDEEARTFIASRVSWAEGKIKGLSGEAEKKTAKEWMKRDLSKEEQDGLLRSFGEEKAEMKEAKEGKNWWGWAKERVLGVTTFGFWEFYQAEKFRRNKNKMAGEISEAGERIMKTDNLSLKDALKEANIMREMALRADVADPRSADYEAYSQRISGEKININNKRIENIVAGSTARLKERLAKYKDEFGKVTVSDEEVMAGFEENLRKSLVELQDGQRAADAKEFNKIITERLDPNYWRRYVYGSLDAALGAWGLKVMITNAAASKLWFGKKAFDASVDAISTVAEAAVENAVEEAAETATEAAVESAAEADQLTMGKNIWHTAREWLQESGIKRPSNQEVLDLSKQIATDNSIAVNEWGISGEQPDTSVEQGRLLNVSGASKVLTAIRIARGLSSIMG